jgi:hypothetical protein
LDGNLALLNGFIDLSLKAIRPSQKGVGHPRKVWASAVG